MTRTYDGLDRLTQEATPQGTVSYTYDAAGRRTSMTVAGEPTITYSYDNADRLIAITQGSVVVSFSYDTAGRRTALTLPNGVTTEYAYDTAGRIVGLTYKNGPTTLGTLSYSYDANGSRRQLAGTWARTGLPGAVASATYDAANRQLTFGGQTLTYDLNGNLVGDGTATSTTNPSPSPIWSWSLGDPLTIASRIPSARRSSSRWRNRASTSTSTTRAASTREQEFRTTGS